VLVGIPSFVNFGTLPVRRDVTVYKASLLPLFFFFLNGSVVTAASRQADTLLDERDLPEVVISVNRVDQSRDELPQQVLSLRSGFISRENLPTTADALQASGQVFVQKSQLGGGSPVLRGFEASRILLVVDDVRMNNLIYRSGHLQNVITLDPFYLERVETVFGPSSTIYGSDALGGVIHLRTRRPGFSQSDQSEFRGEGMLRYATAAHEKTSSFRIEFSGKSWTSLTSIGATSFDDLRMGKKAGSADTVWGLRYQFVERFGDKDSLFRNEDPFLQTSSGYDQIDVLQRFRFRTGVRQEHGLNLQFSSSTDIPRYDRLTDPSGTGLKFAEWYYGPQKRFMASYAFDRSLNNVIFDKLKSIVSYQALEESRYSRPFGSSDRTGRVERVNVVGYTLFLDRENEVHELRAGVDGQLSGVRSTATSLDILTGAVSSASTRYPDGSNSMGNHAVYYSHSWSISDKFELHDGARLTYTDLHSTFDDTTYFPFPFKEVDQDNLALCGNVGMTCRPSKDWKFSLLASSGFRSPNVDDLAKVFDSSPSTVILPNPDLGPERIWSIEAGMDFHIGPITWETNLYHSWFERAIVIAPGTFGGDDSIYYDGVLSAVQSAYNAGSAKVRGLTTSLEAEIGSRWHFVATLTSTEGFLSGTGARTPLDHIPPLFGRISLRYGHREIDAELSFLYNGKKDIDDYSPSGEDNAQYALPIGMPSWSTINIRTSWQASEHWKFQFGMDNVMDINYRTFSSGIHAPGRNLIFSVRIGF
jgi:hemoglobin/transferrin/lactoferrin receptor protein